MGALDFLKEFEGRALDAATYKLLQRNYELQEENNKQLKEKVERLEKDNTVLQKQIDELTTENRELQNKLAECATQNEFVIKGGFAFKIGRDGKFEDTTYCPNCYSVMGYLLDTTYECPKCKYLLNSHFFPEVLAQELNSQQEKKTE
jgi:hypothetical protein